MSTRLLAATIAVAFGVMLYARRLPFPFAELGVLTATVLLLWLGLAADRAPLMAVAALLPLPLFGLRIPFVSDGGGRRDDQLIQLTGDERTIEEPARHVDGLLASRWPRGQLELEGDRLRFVTVDGDELLAADVAEIGRVSLGSWGRGQLTIETPQGRHRFAFGHHPLGRGDARLAQEFWRRTIEARRAEAAD